MAGKLPSEPEDSSDSESEYRDGRVCCGWRAR
eukprot:CAMPEP_0202849924 /NCGR_PEP_ID=MMETSP1389-20130828/82210_1 /ASSEMBLY_ACC=CAM_ASM_000865 /TAXON_ID=302021 /ORGANISM="Rhodomonas sp., Strain CCMP768" /LENGTH=31 /DNA_ID= /DNA_START= /DNA_END= /DNA_ORIENTATION=